MRYLSDDVVIKYLRRQREVLLERGHKIGAKIVKEVLRKFYVKIRELPQAKARGFLTACNGASQPSILWRSTDSNNTSSGAGGISGHV